MWMDSSGSSVASVVNCALALAAGILTTTKRRKEYALLLGAVEGGTSGGLLVGLCC